MQAVQFLRDYDREAAEMCNRVATTEWRHATNSSDYNRRRMNEQQSVAAKFECLSWKRAAAFDLNHLANDRSVRRQLERIRRPGKCGLGDDKYSEYLYLVGLMKDSYNSAKICPYHAEQQRTYYYDSTTIARIDPKLGEYSPAAASSAYSPSSIAASHQQFCDLKLEPDLVRIMETSRNDLELSYVWEQWHEKTGPPMRNTFMRYLVLANEAAERHGFRDAGEQMRSVYEDDDFFFVVQDLWTQTLPLYKQLFTFVRHGLVRKYGTHVVRPDGPIPAHLLGNMWAQNWRSILDVVRREPAETPDVSGEMIRQGFTAQKIFQMAEEFFTSMGLPAMLPEFWRNSMLQKATDPFSQCTASAWDFCNNIDFRYGTQIKY